jgi:hypothetical protein
LNVWFHSQQQAACAKGTNFLKLSRLARKQAIALRKASAPQAHVNNAGETRTGLHTPLALRTDYVFNHAVQSPHVENDDGSAASLDEAHGLQVIELTGSPIGTSVRTICSIRSASRCATSSWRLSFWN